MTNPTDMTVFSLLKTRLNMLGERQRVIADNVANVSTPGYKPRDVDMDAFNKALASASQGGGKLHAASLTLTNTMHQVPTGRSSANVTIQSAPDSESTLDGNSVVVEEQMMKIAETRMDFETMVGLYQKSLGLLRLAARPPR